MEEQLVCRAAARSPSRIPPARPRNKNVRGASPGSGGLIEFDLGAAWGRAQIGREGRYVVTLRSSMGFCEKFTRHITRNISRNRP